MFIHMRIKKVVCLLAMFACLRTFSQSFLHQINYFFYFFYAFINIQDYVNVVLIKLFLISTLYVNM